jgi:hypothetical protein
MKVNILRTGVSTVNCIDVETKHLLPTDAISKRSTTMLKRRTVLLAVEQSGHRPYIYETEQLNAFYSYPFITTF